VGVAGTEYSIRQPEKDRVKNLLGQPSISFTHYSGYIKLGLEAEKSLFYWFLCFMDILNRVGLFHET